MEDNGNHKLLPWGHKLVLLYEVPAIVPCTNKLTLVRNSRSGKMFPKREKKADTFKERIHYSTRQLLGDLKKKHAFLEGVHFPLDGSECQLRVDVILGFNAAGQGQSRMKRSDIDNLKKGIFDGLEGALIDNDRFITEGFTAKGTAPESCQGDLVVLGVSRAGFRDQQDLQFLVGMPIYPPWRAEDRSPIIKPVQPVQKIIH